MKKQRGITLVALVITIILLLILAGITITQLTGENSLFIRAKQAKNNTIDAQNLENSTIADYENKIDEILGNEQEEIQIIGVDIKVSNPEAAKPAGSKIIEGDASKGIVIKDSNNNEWVWVEVPKTIYQADSKYLSNASVPENNEDYINIEKIMQNYAEDYRKSGCEDTWYSEEQHGFKSLTEYNEVKNSMLKSVYTYGGFWIGRYEVGDETATKNNMTRTDTTGIENKAVIKQNQIPYNFVTCKQAQDLSIGLSTGGKISSLMFGIQWDLTCKFLEEKTELTTKDIKENSVSWGNYENSTIKILRGKSNINPNEKTSEWQDVNNENKNKRLFLTTGASDETKKMNLYDFAGNEWEFSLAYSGNDSEACIINGGNYYYSSSTYSGASHRDWNSKSSSTSVGFRPVLFDK